MVVEGGQGWGKGEGGGEAGAVGTGKVCVAGCEWGGVKGKVWWWAGKGNGAGSGAVAGRTHAPEGTEQNTNELLCGGKCSKMVLCKVQVCVC